MALLIDLVTKLQTALTTGNPPIFADTSTCWYAFDPQESLKNPPSDQFCVIQPTGLSVKQRSWAGNAKINYVYTWTCTIWLFVRLATDEAHRDDSYLLDQANGSIALADKVISKLQDYVTPDGFGYELDSIEWPNQDRDSKGWAATRLQCHTDITGRSA